MCREFSTDTSGKRTDVCMEGMCVLCLEMNVLRELCSECWQVTTVTLIPMSSPRPQTMADLSEDHFCLHCIIVTREKKECGDY
jgi:hypothetical protein